MSAASRTTTATAPDYSDSTQTDGASRTKRMRKFPQNASLDSQERVGTNSKWLLNIDNSAGGMVLNDNLGDTPQIVDSLTHQVNNWSLTTMPSDHNTNEIKEKRKAAKRNIMRVLFRPGSNVGKSE